MSAIRRSGTHVGAGCLATMRSSDLPKLPRLRLRKGRLGGVIDGAEAWKPAPTWVVGRTRAACACEPTRWGWA
jgi:hypothetical protein